MIKALQKNKWFLYAALTMAANAYCYDTALEIQRTNASAFEGFELEWSSNPIDRNSWTPIYLTSNDSDGSTLFLYGSLSKNNHKNAYFRIWRQQDNKISDVHFANVKKLSTNFIKQEIIEGVADNNTVYDTKYSTPYFSYFKMRFKLKDWGDDPPVWRLKLPNPFESFLRGRVYFFSWEAVNNIAGLNASKLVIVDSDENICQEIPVNNLTSYEWRVPDNYPNGVYYWQIRQSVSPDETYGSEIRPFIIADDVTDTDDDRYFDDVELARGSDPNDPQDIPLIITSPAECQQAYKEQQYFNVFKANRSESLEWQLIGRLPEGLRLSSGGVLQGRPQNTGDYIFAVSVYDQKGKTDEKTFHLEILKPAPSSVRMGCGGFR